MQKHTTLMTYAALLLTSLVTLSEPTKTGHDKKAQYTSHIRQV